jgi:hypothetical protein
VLATMIDDETLRDMTREQRADLSRRLAALTSEAPLLDAAGKRRHRLIGVMSFASLGLIPWIVVLAMTLPHRYVANHWTLTWVGFDIVLLGSLALTAWLAWKCRQAVVITALITATLLVCDAWFDIATSAGGTDTLVAIGSAVLLELPLAVLLFANARNLLRLTVRRTQAIEGLVDRPFGLFNLPLLGVPAPRRGAGTEPT